VYTVTSMASGIARALTKLVGRGRTPFVPSLSSFLPRLLSSPSSHLASASPLPVFALTLSRGVKSWASGGKSLDDGMADFFPPSTGASVVAPAAAPSSMHDVADSRYLDRVLEGGSVVKVYCVSSSPNPILPWQNKPQAENTGSGFILSGRKILTNAHVVADHKVVQVRKHGDPDLYVAEVRAVGHDCDLALLSIEDERFWQGVLELELGSVPDLQDAVAVVGYPTGGDNISVTGGVVSRIERQTYVHGASQLLAVQIDAAINPGNSGGPALKNDKVVGVAFQNMMDADNIGYIIPVPIIEHFLADVEQHPSYKGFGHLGISVQMASNRSLRHYLGMAADQTGVVVCDVLPLAGAAKALKRHDVILEVEGKKVANDGTVAFRRSERVFFDYEVLSKQIGDVISMKVLRDGDVKEVEVEVKKADYLVTPTTYDELPKYFIHAGFVFTAFTQPYLREWGEDWAYTSPRQLHHEALFGIKKKEGQEIVIVGHVLADQINTGYEWLATHRVSKFNGEDILNLDDFWQKLRQNRETFLKIELHGGEIIILDRVEAEKASRRIMANYRISDTLLHSHHLRTGDDADMSGQE